MTALTQEIARVGMRVVVNDAMPAYRGWAGTVIRATPSPGEPGRPFNWVKVKLDDHPHPAQWHVSYFDLLP